MDVQNACLKATPAQTEGPAWKDATNLGLPMLGLPHDTSLLVENLLRERPYSRALYLWFGCVSDVESDATSCTVQIPSLWSWTCHGVETW